jgi:hypothetical protein
MFLASISALFLPKETRGLDLDDVFKESDEELNLNAALLEEYPMNA